MGKPEDSTPRETSGSEVAPPPPYTEVVQNAQGEGSAPPNYNSHAPVAIAISPYQPFPQVLDAHYQWKSASVFHLGDDANKRLFAVSVHTGWGGKGPGRPGMILHNGPTDKDLMLAAAGEEGEKASTYSPNSIITLPALSGGAPGQYCTEVMRASKNMDTVVFRFSIEVGQKELHREDFEWRKSKGDEVKDFVESPWKCGFKLVRLSTHQNGGSSSQKAAGTEQEVVAVFAWSSTWSVMTPFKVQFRGSGRDGALGERFTLMAVITSLRLWWLKQQGRTSENTIAAGEAGLVPWATG
ncbi:hypothetical protein F5Y04DRAFT_242075 [Hypomontagnella monticulosa]|nr:hypothetical protein F5Y04DRAFT_242075 [Hypomontagnella monticulosa]